MKLENVLPNPFLEKRDAFNIPDANLEISKYPEHLFQKGFRIRNEYSEDQKGVKLIIQAAKLGHPVALAVCFKDGLKTDCDPKRAANLFQQSAERGHPVAQHYLGVFYTRGIGVNTDFKAAAKWFKAAADQGHEAAQMAYGYCCGGNAIGLDKDYPTAIRYFKMTDHPDATQSLKVTLKRFVKTFSPAEVNLKSCEFKRDLDLSCTEGKVTAYQRLKFGIGIHKNENLAKEIIFDAALDRNPMAFAICILEGIEFERDEASAKRFFGETLESPHSSYYLGKLTNDMNLVIKAADSGHVPAMFYYAEHISETDPLLGLHYYQKAKRFRSSDALFKLGVLLKEGRPFLSRNIQTSAKYLKKASDLGQQDALGYVNFFSSYVLDAKFSQLLKAGELLGKVNEFLKTELQSLSDELNFAQNELKNELNLIKIDPLRNVDHRNSSRKRVVELSSKIISDGEAMVQNISDLESKQAYRSAIGPIEEGMFRKAFDIFVKWKLTFQSVDPPVTIPSIKKLEGEYLIDESCLRTVELFHSQVQQTFERNFKLQVQNKASIEPYSELLFAGVRESRVILEKLKAEILELLQKARSVDEEKWLKFDLGSLLTKYRDRCEKLEQAQVKNFALSVRKRYPLPSIQEKHEAALEIKKAQDLLAKVIQKCNQISNHLPEILADHCLRLDVARNTEINVDLIGELFANSSVWSSREDYGKMKLGPDLTHPIITIGLQEVTGMHKGYMITKIETLSNERLLRAFENKRLELVEDMRRDLERGCDIPKIDPECFREWQVRFGMIGQDHMVSGNEVFLFHGCPPLAAKRIIKEGFDNRVTIPTLKDNKLAYGYFGNGMYFAENPNKSDEYSGVDSSGERCMFGCRVLLGNPYITSCDARSNIPVTILPGKQNRMWATTRAPFNDLADRPHDSLIHVCQRISGAAHSWPTKNSNFVIYDRAQVYPEILIWYRRIPI